MTHGSGELFGMGESVWRGIDREEVNEIEE